MYNHNSRVLALWNILLLDTFGAKPISLPKESSLQLVVQPLMERKAASTKQIIFSTIDHMNVPIVQEAMRSDFRLYCPISPLDDGEHFHCWVCWQVRGRYLHMGQPINQSNERDIVNISPSPSYIESRAQLIRQQHGNRWTPAQVNGQTSQKSWIELIRFHLMYQWEWMRGAGSKLAPDKSHKGRSPSVVNRVDFEPKRFYRCHTNMVERNQLIFVYRTSQHSVFSQTKSMLKERGVSVKRWE